MQTNASTAATYTKTGLDNGTRYYFRVSATNSVGESSYSAEISAIPTAVLSSAKDILSLTFGTLGSATISGTNISMTVPPGTAVTNLAPTYIVSPLSRGTPLSGTSRNFSTPQSYTITAEDGSSKTYVVTINVSPPSWINVNIDTVARTGLVGPAGGANATWNQQLGASGLTANGLLDANGAATTVGFSCSAGSVDPWGLPNLTLLTAGAFNFGANTPATLVINGLPTGRKFDLYIASYYPNEDGSKGVFSTTSLTTSVGTQSYDNGGPNGNASTWVRGTNYVLFQNLVPDASRKITLTFVSGLPNYRAMVNGFQVVDVTYAPTTTTLGRTAGPNPSGFGTPVTFTATVTGTNAPSGNVTFYDGTAPIGTNALNASFQASFTTSTLTIGAHNISARYAGNATNPPSDSPYLPHTVVDSRPATTTALALTGGTNPSSKGAILTFTATVTGATPSGNVAFYDRDRLMGTIALNGSFQASLSTSTLPFGLRSITARYEGDPNNAPSVSTRFVQTVNPPPGNGMLKVFLLAGQSNMQGYGKLEYGRDPNNLSGPEIPGGLGCLRYAVTNNPLKYDYLLDPAHPVNGKPGWITRSDVWVSFWDGVNGDPNGTTVERRNGMLDAGFGVGASLDSGLIGPEYGFGLVVGSALEDPVLLIKTAWGGKSLAVDFRPPSSGNTGPNYLLMISSAHLVLDNLQTYYPAYSGAGFEIAGFGWHQGWNDRVDANFTAQYETNLANLIRDIRAEFGVPKMPFVIANTGMANAPGGPGSLIEAQFAVANTNKYPEFAGNVTTVDTRPFDYGELQSPNGFGYHWYWNGESYFNIGESMGTAMMALLSAEPPVPVLPGNGITISNGVANFAFPTMSGLKYRVLYKTALADLSWQPVIAPPTFSLPDGWSATSTGSSMSLSDTNAAGQTQRFYRLEVANP